MFNQSIRLITYNDLTKLDNCIFIASSQGNKDFKARVESNLYIFFKIILCF